MTIWILAVQRLLKPVLCDDYCTQCIIKIQSIHSIKFHIASCFVTLLFREVIVYYYYYLDMALLFIGCEQAVWSKTGCDTLSLNFATLNKTLEAHWKPAHPQKAFRNFPSYKNNITFINYEEEHWSNIFPQCRVNKHLPLTLVNSFFSEESDLKYYSELFYTMYAQNTSAY